MSPINWLYSDKSVDGPDIICTALLFADPQSLHRVAAMSLTLAPCLLQVSWVQPRVLTLDQASGLKFRLDGWIDKVTATSTILPDDQLNAIDL